MTETTQQPFDELEAAELGLLTVGEDGETPIRRTRGRIKKKNAALDVYKAGRDAILAEEDYGTVYDEVDEDDYQARRAQRLAEADFIEDDGTGDFDGYYDDGRDIFEDEDMLEGNTIAAKRARQQRKGGSGTGTARKKAAPKRRVNSLFTGGKSSRLGAHVVKMGDDAAAVEQDSFLAEVMAEEDNPEEDADLKAALNARKKKKSKQSLAHLALFGTSAQAREAMLETNDDMEEDEDIQVDARPPRREEWASSTREDDEGFTWDAPEPPVKMEVDEPATSTKVETKPASVQERARPAAPKPAPPPKAQVAVVAMAEDDDEDDDDNENGTARNSYLKTSRPKPLQTPSEWENVRREAQPVNDVPEVKVDSSKLPLDEYEGEQVLHFYWLDAYEPPFGHKAGSIYLFGKVFVEEAKAFVSCCVEVTNLQRDLFVLPRACKLDARGNETNEEVSVQDVYEEVDALLRRQGISKYRAKPVNRNYAFEEADVPREPTEYLKVKYDANLGKLQSDCNGRTFSHIFGTNISPLERFLMKRDLMGPCWLRIKGATCVQQPYSWCKVEAVVDNAKNIVKMEAQKPSPPLTVLSISMQTILNRKTHTNEILAITGLVSHAMKLDGKLEQPEKTFSHFSAMRKLGDNPFPFDLRTAVSQSKRNVELSGSERTLLAFFITKVFRIDPDVIVGHNLFGFDLDVLLHRIRHHKIPNWSRLGRLRRSPQMPNLKAGLGNRTNMAVERDLLSGRLLCDTMVSARELIRQVSYGLTELSSTQLDVKRTEIDQERLPVFYNQTPTLLRLLDHVEMDAYLVIRLLLKLDVLPLMKQITNITGGILSRTLTRGRADRNEFLLCHEFYRRKFIVPDKPAFGANDKKAKGDGDAGEGAEGAEGQQQPNKAKRKPAYAGGLVLEPKRGFYDQYILLLDFNSLYPSIIQEYNLCFTTVDRAHLVAGPAAGEGSAGDAVDTGLADVPDGSLPRGVLPHVLRNLIQKRKVVKSLIKEESDPNKLAEYDVRQKALKLTANSMYGCLGFKGSRYYAKPIAELITSKGREILQKTVDLAQEQLNLDVIYGDTDSIMVNTRSTDLTEVKQIGNRVKKEVNALYRELEIDIDGVYKTMLLLKKKKYAAMAITEKNGKLVELRETKGLDIVRRDWSAIAHDVGNYILNQILTQEQGGREELVERCHDYLRGVAEDIRTPGKVDLEKFIIHKNLTKDPEAYPDKKNQPHVLVALRMKSQGKSVRALDTIPYIICKDGSENAASARAYHIDDLRKNETLEVDIDYYLKNQIHPVVGRMMEPIEGTDNSQIALCLGLDPGAFRREYTMQDVDEEIGMGLMSQMSDEERYRTAEEWRVTCQACGESTTFPGVFRKQGESLRCGLLCPNASCSATLTSTRLCNLMAMEARKYIGRYYDGHLVCDDPACRRGDGKTQQLSVLGRNCLDPLCRGTMHPVYTDKQLYTQLSYFVHLFDVPHALDQLKEARGHGQSLLSGYQTIFQACKQHADKLLEKSARRHVQLGQLFSCIMSERLI